MKRLTAHLGIPSAEAWHGLELEHVPLLVLGVAGEDVIGPVDGEDVVLLDVGLLADEGGVEREALVAGEPDPGKLLGENDEVGTVTGRVAEAITILEMQEQTAFAELEADNAVNIPQFETAQASAEA
jgi:hypothetical protein